MKITKEWLEDNNACKEGIEFIKQAGFIDLPVKEFIEKLIKIDKLDWANWIIIHILNSIDLLKYAIYAAEEVLPIFEDKYPNDDCLRKAIESAKVFNENPHKETDNTIIVESYNNAIVASDVAFASRLTRKDNIYAYITLAIAHVVKAVDSALFATNSTYSVILDARSATYAVFNIYFYDTTDTTDTNIYTIYKKILEYGINFI